MKKILSLLSVCALLSLAACNNATNDKNDNDNADTTHMNSSGTTVETTVTEPAPAGDHMHSDSANRM
jgi:protein involved in sex pheromone biosynthesis